MAMIALAGFIHETNTFAPLRTTWDDFVRPGGFCGLAAGPEVLKRPYGENSAIGGFIARALESGHELEPLCWCAAVPSGYVTQNAFERFLGLLAEALRNARPLDALYIDLHGAMVAEHLEDGEGQLLRAIREIVGDEVLVVATLDLHANTTPDMVLHSDGLVACRTYPHVDMHETGERAARFLDEMLKGIRPAKTRRALPFLIPLPAQCTLVDPMLGVYRKLVELEEQPDVHLVSFTPGFPSADIRDCGPAIVAYAETMRAAERAADALYDYLLAREGTFEIELMAPADAVRQAMRAIAEKPVILVDAQDNSGAGATSDTTGILAELVRQGAERAVVGVLADAEAARRAHQAGVGGRFRGAIGGKLYTQGDPPLLADWQVLALSDGKFDCTGGYLGGINVDLGPMAYLQTAGVGVVVSTHRFQAADQAMFRHLGCDPTQLDILVVKSTVHFRADFGELAKHILYVAAPAVCEMLPEKMAYRRLRPGVRLRPNGPGH
jgi:microcystin degradation protein MlrC